MDYLYSDDPIIACSTNNTTNSAIAILRLSGFNSLDDIYPFINIKNIKPRFAHFCKLVFNDFLFDEIVLTFFPAPNSYNGENIVELSVHGNTLNVERIIKLFVEHSNFRQAYPGEFSYRALKNNKLSLSQVEGLDLLLNANSNFILNQGFSLLSGRLQKSYLSLHKAFLAHKSAVELSIDFLDDIGEENANKQFKDSFSNLLTTIEKLKIHAQNSANDLVNPEITIVGLPNAGKSSLFNLLLQDNRAIVSNIAGTTRDFISENIKIGDLYCRLVDTAGIRKTDDIIESQGIERSLDLLSTSFYKILIINPMQFDKEFFEELKNIDFDLILFSHIDVRDFDKYVEKVYLNFKEIGFKINGPIEPISCGPIEPTISGPIGANLSEENSDLLSYIVHMVNKKYLSQIQNEPISLSRHRDSINKIYQLICDYSDLCSIERDISIISSELNGIGHCISELIGIVSPDDVLHNIFTNFCIGK